MSARLDVLVDRCFGAALLMASIDARVEGIYARGEKPPACWEDSRAFVRGIIAAALAEASVSDRELVTSEAIFAGLMDQLCAIAADCGVQQPEAFFA